MSVRQHTTSPVQIPVAYLYGVVYNIGSFFSELPQTKSNLGHLMPRWLESEGGCRKHLGWWIWEPELRRSVNTPDEL